MTKSVIGDSPRRREDLRFLTGRGRYIDDLRFENLAHAVFVRSPHAHARVRSVEVSTARKAPGVLAVLTAADVAADGLKSLRRPDEVARLRGKSDEEVSTGGMLRAYRETKRAQAEPKQAEVAS